jgi:hypothetical protein
VLGRIDGRIVKSGPQMAATAASLTNGAAASKPLENPAVRVVAIVREKADGPIAVKESEGAEIVATGAAARTSGAHPRSLRRHRQSVREPIRIRHLPLWLL